LNIGHSEKKADGGSVLDLSAGSVRTFTKPFSAIQTFDETLRKGE
jgi:uncharacterized cupin superfamily protein